MRNKACLLVCALAALFLIVPPALAGVMPPHSTVAGKSMGEWGAVWSTWFYTLPHDPPTVVHPSFDPAGPPPAVGSADVAAMGNQGSVFFLMGVQRSTSDPPAPAVVVRERNVVVPEGMPIYIPILNTFASAGRVDRPQDRQGLIDRVNNTMALITEPMHLTIDGVAVPDLTSYREPPADVFDVTFGPKNLYGVGTGAGTPLQPVERLGVPWMSYTDGYAVMLEPLSIGQHTIKFDGMFGAAASPAFAMDLTYNVTVVPEPGAMLAAAGLALLFIRRRNV